MIAFSEKERTILMACTILDSVFDPTSRSFVKPIQFLNGQFSVPHLRVGTTQLLSQADSWSFVKDLILDVIKASYSQLWHDAIRVSIKQSLNHYGDWRNRVLDMFSGSFTKFSDDVADLCMAIEGLRAGRASRQVEKAALHVRVYNNAHPIIATESRQESLRRSLRFADSDEAREIRQELETLESAGENPVLSK